MAAKAPKYKLYRILRCTVVPLICRLNGFSTVRGFRYDAANGASNDAANGAPNNTPMFIVANHNDDLDPMYLGAAFAEPLCFVASEHVFRFGFLSKILVKLFDPIARAKGTTDARAALQILRRLKRGQSVCLFAEGNRSYTGVTGPVFPATGKLARASGAALVTYRIEGGYLSTPRWALARRHGSIRGGIVNIYPPETLKRMTDDAVNAAIASDLFVDAFALQEKQMRPYRGKRLAEGIEYALWLCPKCGGIGTIRGEGGRVVCDNCGTLAHINAYGFFEGEDAPFSTVRDWDAWQDGELTRMAKEAALSPGTVVFSDAGQTLYAIGDAHESTVVNTGTLSITADTLTVGGTSFPLDTIADLAVCGRGKLVFAVGAAQYEIASKPPKCGRKYSTFLQKLREKR